MLTLLIFTALLIPVIGILVDSPIGRAIAKRLERSQPQTEDRLPELEQQIEALREEVADLNEQVTQLRDENQFIQRLLENHQSQRRLPPTSN